MSPRDRRPGYGWGRILAALALLAIGCVLTLSLGLAFGLSATGEATRNDGVTVRTVIQGAGPIALWSLVVLGIGASLFGMKPGDFFAWTSRFRLGFFGQALIVALIGLGLYWGVLLAVQGAGFRAITGGVILTVLVVLLVLPLQATAEELLFRGFGPQIIQGKIGSSAATFWLTHVVFAMLFASPHGGSGVTAWLMFIVFGLIFSYVTPALRPRRAWVADR